MNVIWQKHALEQYQYWQRTDRKIARHINQLINAIKNDPFAGIGKPEPLKRNLAGWWSRRITKQHRLVYRVKGDIIEIAQCRFHYE